MQTLVKVTKSGQSDISSRCCAKLVIKMVRLSIHLTDGKSIYTPGDSIHGLVIVQYERDNELSNSDVCLKCRGKGYVAWNEGTRGSMRRYYRGNEDYLNGILKLYEGQGKQETGVEADKYKINFEVELPWDVPASYYKDAFCNVSYWLKAYVERAGKKVADANLGFKVAGNLDLNTWPNALKPMDGSCTKYACCLCCRTGPISARMRIDRTAYVPGENIQIEAAVDDESGRGTNGTKIKLTMWTFVRGTDPVNGDGQDFSWHTYVVRERGPVAPGESDAWSDVISVPQVPPSGLPGCTIIDLKYVLEMSVDVKNTPFDLRVEHDIVIGSIPHRQAVNQVLSDSPPEHRHNVLPPTSPDFKTSEQSPSTKTKSCKSESTQLPSSLRHHTARSVDDYVDKPRNAPACYETQI